MSTEERLARLETKVESLEETLEEMRLDLRAVRDFTTEVQGGKKLAIALWAVAGAAIGWMLHFIVVK